LHVKSKVLKKIINIFFVTVFTIISIGFTVNKHYSGSKLFSFAIFSEPESCCAANCNCCHEETETIQFRADYTFSFDHGVCNPSELQLFAHAVLLNIQEPELVLVKTEFTDQDLPPPDKLTRLSYFQSFLL